MNLLGIIKHTFGFAKAKKSSSARRKSAKKSSRRSVKRARGKRS